MKHFFPNSDKYLCTRKELKLFLVACLFRHEDPLFCRLRIWLSHLLFAWTQMMQLIMSNSSCGVDWKPHWWADDAHQARTKLNCLEWSCHITENTSKQSISGVTNLPSDNITEGKLSPPPPCAQAVQVFCFVLRCGKKDERRIVSDSDSSPSIQVGSKP